MIFRKNSLLFYQSQTIYVLMIAFCFILTPILGLLISFTCALPFAIFALISPKLYNEFITVNEFGISCHKSGKLLWSYDWDSISDIKRSSRFLLPSMEILTYTNGKPAEFAIHGHYFQLGRIAKKAIKCYYIV